MSSSSTAALTAATEMVRAQIVAVPIDQLIGQPTQKSVLHLIDQLAAFTSHLSTQKWSGHHSYLALILSADKMKLITNDANLNCSCLLLPARINPAITDTSTGRKLLQLQDVIFFGMSGLHISTGHQQDWRSSHRQCGRRTIC